MQSFRIKVIARIVVITATLTLISFLFFQSEYYLALLALVLSAIGQVISLVRVVDKTNRDVHRFLDSIAYSDFTQSFTPRNEGKTFDDLHRLFTAVLERFRLVRTEGEEQSKYLEFVVQSVAAGLISFDGKGDVLLINRAAKKLLGLNHLKNLADLTRIDMDLAELLFSMKSGESVNISLAVESNVVQQMRFSASKFKLGGESITLIAFQNIQQELDEKELEAWQTLTKVLTHEIMNSMTPIATMSSAMVESLNSLEKSGEGDILVDKETFDDLNTAFTTIGRRSGGLIDFVQRFKSLSQIDTPKFEVLNVQDLINEVVNLQDAKAEEEGVKISVKVHLESLQVTADPTLVEQVLMNLIKNALESVQTSTNPEVSISSFMDDKMRVVIEVADNGDGISETAIQKIFVPFFSTKKGGSGIGLSLSRQIMRLHGGSLNVKSTSDDGTVFSMVF